MSDFQNIRSEPEQGAVVYAGNMKGYEFKFVDSHNHIGRLCMTGKDVYNRARLD